MPAPNGSIWVANNGGLVEIEPDSVRILSRMTKADGLLDFTAPAISVAGLEDQAAYRHSPAITVTLYDASASS